MEKLPSLAEWRAGGAYMTFKGQRIFYRSEGQGQTLVLLHGFPMSSWDWRYIYPELIRHYRVITLDMLGFGFSEKPDKNHYTIFEQADLMEALLCQLGVHNYHIVAHDYGINVALELLARNQYGQGRQSAMSACLLGSGSLKQCIKGRLRGLYASPVARMAMRKIGKRMIYRHIARRFASPDKLNLREWDQGWSAVECNNGTQILHKLLGYIGERQYYHQRWMRALENCNVPIRLIVGESAEHDQNGVFQDLSGLGNATDVRMLSRVGDFPHLELPHRVCDELMDFYDMLRSGHHWLGRRTAV